MLEFRLSFRTKVIDFVIFFPRPSVFVDTTMRTTISEIDSQLGTMKLVIFTAVDFRQPANEIWQREDLL